MGLSSTLGSFLFFLGLCGICAGFVQENCTDYKLQFERVFSVPGDVAMLNSTLVSPEVFNFTTAPYSITWYNSTTEEEMKNKTGQILVYGETLWFLNVTLDDDGEYVAVVRTPSKCYMQATKLVVDLPVPGECGRPQRAVQPLTNGASDTLHCPLGDYIDKLDSYNIPSSIQWYRGCDPIVDGIDEYIYRDKTKLAITEVGPQNNCLHTCTLTFTLDGVMRSVSETINAEVKDFHLAPQVHEPANEIIKAPMGSTFSKRCLVFVPGVESPFIDVLWMVRGEFIFTTLPSDRVYTSEPRIWSQDDHIKGTWIERMLMFSELKKEDFNISYTCTVHSSRGIPKGHFTLLQADLDGKLYDAYVAYPQPYDFGFSNEVETFALHTLPQVLEKACDYKLFIANRDSLPGQVTVDSVEENIQASRRLLLLYTASTFIGKRHTCSTSSNNNNISKSSDISDKSEIKTSETSDSMTCDCSDKSYPDTRQQFECVAALHRALLEGSLKVVLVELEEITPAQLALFPESVRHLRKKQGAVCWWKNLRTRQRWRTCMSRKEDEEKGGKDSQRSPSLSPSSTFWKEVRYHMPIRGKRVVYPEKTALLSL
uniref:Zmp:0000000936 n=1 Tax=Amphiprion percula TaxID=161767 RepID=A0A3P8RTI5_AMPPE